MNPRDSIDWTVARPPRAHAALVARWPSSAEEADSRRRDLHSHTAAIALRERP